MAHEFPKELAKNNFGRDPEILNERFRRLAGEIGDLNEHDLKAGLISAVSKVQNNAIHSLTSVRHQCDPQLENGGGGSWYPFPGADADTLFIPDDVSWTSIASVTVTTGEDTLYMVGQFTYAGHGSLETIPDLFCVRAQFALEVDGAILDDTITGHVDPMFVGVNFVYKTGHGEVSAETWDYRHLEPLPELGGMNKNLASGRVIFAVDVGEGTHTVRLMARRCPRTDLLPDVVAVPVPFSSFKDDRENLYYRNKQLPGTQDPASFQPGLYVYNRGLYVIKIGGWQKAGTTTQSSFSPADLQEGDVFSETALETNRITAAAAVVNDLREGDLARGSLRAEHLPSVSTSSQSAISSNITVNTEYTGFENTVGDILLTVACSLNPADTGFVLITADIEVEDINVAAGFKQDGGLFIGKIIAVGASGTLYVLQGTEAYMSSDVLDPDDPLAYTVAPVDVIDGTIAEPWDNMNLTWASAVSALPETITALRVYGCVWDTIGGPASTPSAEIKRRHLNYIHFKK